MAAAPSGLDATDIITQATMATTLVKMLVDLIKLCWGGDTGKPPQWIAPVASLVCGVSIMALLAVALGQDLTHSRVIASTVLAGLMAAVGAIGVTELHKLARQPGAGAIEWTSQTNAVSPPATAIAALEFSEHPREALSPRPFPNVGGGATLGPGSLTTTPNLTGSGSQPPRQSALG